jgi:hypothetical protein
MSGYLKQELSETILYRLQNIYFKLEQLNESIRVTKTSQANRMISDNEKHELTSNMQYYLSELDEALSNDL